MDGLRAPDGLGARLRQTDVPHVAGHDHLGDRADRVFDGDRGIDATEPVDVDVVGAQALQRVRECVLHGDRPPVDPEEGVVRRSESAELHADHDVVATPTAQGVPDQELVVAHAVVVAGVQQRDAGLDRRADRRDALVTIGGTVGAGHPHATEPERRHDRAGRAERRSSTALLLRADREDHVAPVVERIGEPFREHRARMSLERVPAVAEHLPDEPSPTPRPGARRGSRRGRTTIRTARARCGRGAAPRRAAPARPPPGP